MWSRIQKPLNLFLIGSLTSLTLAATYWQSTRYLQSKTKWHRIANQLSKKQPSSLQHLKSNDLFTLRYVQVQGIIGNNMILISRAREGRMGYLVVKALQYIDQDKQTRTILAVVGWIPQQFQYISTTIAGTFKGILRDKQKKDYLNKNVKKQNLQLVNFKTYLDFDQAITQLHLQNKNTNKDYYFQQLKQLQYQKNKQQCYPYQYSVDNFQLPYLTPDKHRAYAMFWGCTSLAGLVALFKIFKMK